MIRRDRLRQAAAARGCHSDAELARRIGVSEETVRRVMNGETPGWAFTLGAWREFGLDYRELVVR